MKCKPNFGESIQVSMKIFSIFIVLFMPTLTFAHSVSWSKDFHLIFPVAISLFCLIVSFFISIRATSPMSIVGLILFAFLSFIPSIFIIHDKNITFENAPLLYPVQVSLLFLLVVPLLIYFFFTFKWLKSNNNLEKQKLPDWRELKDSLKNNPLECSLFEKEVKNTAILYQDNGKYILKTYSGGIGNESLVTDNTFESIELLNKFLRDSTNFRLRDFLN